MNVFYDTILKSANDDRIKIKKSCIRDELQNFQESLKKIYAKVSSSTYNCLIPTTHSYYNPDAIGTHLEITQKILESLPDCLIQLIESKFSLGDKAFYYIKGYAKFMTLIYFSKFSLTPSEEVDLVWHTHQSLTIDYRNFCYNIFGKFIHHTPTVGGRSQSEKFLNSYEDTLGFYRFLFKKNPHMGLWPSSADRFDPNNFAGS